MKNLKLFSFSLLVVFSACTKDIKPSEELKLFGFKNIDEVRAHLGKYADLFVTTNGSIYQSSIKSNNLTTEDWDIFARFTNDPFAPRINGGDFFINTTKMVFDNAKQTYVVSGKDNPSEEELGLLLKGNFGKENEAKLIRNGETIFQSHYYVPNEIAATNLTNFERYDGSAFIKISRKGLNLQWNKDAKNANGVVAYLSWTGDNVDLPADKQGTQGNVEIAAKFEDTGNTTISSNFFQGIPKHASFTLFLIRGNVEVKDGSDNKNYKFYSYSWYNIRCVLVD